jgi:dihydroflavonol-4-reductase
MILITGANGLIGSQLVIKLLQENLSVRILLRASADTSLIESQKQKIQISEGNILDIPSLENALIGIDTIIHCAATVSFAEKANENMFQTNVEGTKNVVNIALKKNIRLIYLSSVAAIGRDPKSNIINENTQWVNSELNSFYAQTKYLAELEVWRGIEEGLNAVMLNPSVVLGPGNWNKSSTKIFKNIFDGMLVFPTGSTNVVDVRDVADAVSIILASSIRSERYIISGHHLSYENFFKQISISFGKKPPYIKVNKNTSLFIYFLLKPILGFYFHNKFINKETISITSSHFLYENEKFGIKFNFSYRSLDETIPWVCEELMEKYARK